MFLQARACRAPDYACLPARRDDKEFTISGCILRNDEAGHVLRLLHMGRNAESRFDRRNNLDRREFHRRRGSGRTARGTSGITASIASGPYSRRRVFHKLFQQGAQRRSIADRESAMKARGKAADAKGWIVKPLKGNSALETFKKLANG
ncbi:hypothetical protein Bxe_C1387 [Paraburkholderia xenovorans LB400]|uniref:Uncharacterized protein n=1 Tax=Paraburkholderia xenovorans (strain LB400) TaxID=266265 RepID=Q13FA4_PARXL|nr:hypothetical protein Bxe_C1387 [Paraburkholderia xenovorans LB400]